jgi:aspartyl-tRNA(Asn)/glutamyl-tRNA(Gln) amidotransferase subunit A
VVNHAVHQSPGKGARRTLGLCQALDDLAKGLVTASALTKHALENAEASKRALNAFSVVAWDRAMEAAAESDRRYAEGKQRPLEGLPIGVKDLIDTKGIETRYGSAAYIGNVPATDAAIVRALVEQGAIIIGKTATHEFAWGVTTASPVFGNTLNPLDTTRIPGGSSGGAAAAIGFGAVAAGLGTDTGGSVRIPAALCGIVGFKPTLGTFSTEGIFPLAPTLDHPGLLGAGVDDVVVLAEQLGIEVSDHDAFEPARVGVVREIAPIPLSLEVGSSFDRAIGRLGEFLALEKIDTSGLFEGVFQTFAGIVLTEAGVAHFGRNDWDWIATHYSAETVERLERARAAVLGDYAQSQQTRRRFTAKLCRVMSTIDYLVLPTAPCTAPRAGETTVTIGEWSGTVREALMTYTAPFNVAGFPAISIPLGIDDQSLPAALQIVARQGGDGALLRIARKMEVMLKTGFGPGNL